MSANEGQPSSSSPGVNPTGQHPADHRPDGHDDYDFTPKPPPDGSRLAGIVGLVMGDKPNGSLKADGSSQTGTIPGINPGPGWHRGPQQEPMGPPTFRKTAHQRNRRFANEAKVRKGMKAMMSDLAGDTFALEDSGTSPTGRRMVVVDQLFYEQERPYNHRPQPIRKGAGKGPRQAHYPPIRC